MLKLKWCDDLKAESDFRAMNIPYSKRTIKFSQIDLEESRTNGARIGEAVIASLVEDYAQGMRNGDTFPSPVVYKARRGFVLTSGVQRSHAVKLLIGSGEVTKNPSIEVYELETGDMFLIEAISRAANVSHGSRTTPQERMAHAVYMVNTHGMKPQDAAVLYMVSANGIRSNIRGEKVRRELGQQGIDVSGVSNGSLDKLNKLNNDAGAMKKLGYLVAMHKPTIQETEIMVDRASKPKTEAGRRGAIKKIEKELVEASRSYGRERRTKKAAPKMPSRVRRDKLVSYLDKLASFLEYGNNGASFVALDELQVTTESDIKRVNTLWAKVNLHMKVIVKSK